MKLTSKQIQNLYQFTRKHFVEFYDLQTELVDHLANDIEHIWQIEPKLTFEEAKQKSFKKFGIFGFMDVLDERSKALSKRYFKLFWRAFKQFFTIPKIALTINLFFAVLFLLRFVNYNKIVVFILPLVLMYFPFSHMIKSTKQIKKNWKKTGRKYMFENYIANLGGLGVVIQFPFQFLFHFADTINWSLKMKITYSLTMVISALVYYIFIYEMPSTIRAILIKEHPEYQIDA